MTAVTETRNFSEEISPSRNKADECAWCNTVFAPGRMRYPILGVGHIESVCMDCFKAGYDDPTILDQCISRLKRVVRNCAGCGEPMLTMAKARRGQWHVCSYRCYQRDYRKRRRGVGSVINWKLESRPPQCACCRRAFKPKRRDALYCSNKCRQRRYRTAGTAP